MNVKLTEEQSILQDSARKFLEAQIPIAKVRELADNAAGLTDDLWTKIAEQGWLSLMIPEADGGLGLGVTELAIVCEEMGRLVTPGAFLSTVLAAHAIALGGDAATKSAWLEKLGSGEARGSLALLEDDGQLCAASVKCAASGAGAGCTLTGKKSLAHDIVAANVAIVSARDAAGVSLYVVGLGGKGVTVKGNKLVDLTRRSGQLYLDKAPATKLSGGWDTLEKVLLAANVCIAADCIGGAEYIHRLTVAYAKERTQFGKLIGSFQAVKHPLVDLFAKNESARSAYHYAAWAVDANNPDAPQAVAVARMTCTEAYRATTLDCLQAHGGIAFTWEYDLHLYLKRAKHNQFLYGEPRDSEEVICKRALGI